DCKYLTEEFSKAVKSILEEKRPTGSFLHGLERMAYSDLNMAKYTPLKASSYIPLPKKLKTKKAIVNIKNTDNKCFMWSVLAALHPIEYNRKPERLHHYKEFENVLDFSGIEFPVTIDKIGKFESQNNISVNVFGFEDVLFPIRITKEHFDTHVNLLLYYQGTTRHYCLIKDLNKLLYDQNGHKYDLLQDHEPHCCQHGAQHYHKQLKESFVEPHTTNFMNASLQRNILKRINVLNDEHISDADYDHATRVFEAFSCQSMGDYHDLYLKSDVLLLADVFENFRNVCLKAYNLDPCHFYTSPGLAWQACLKMTEVELQLLTDPDMYLFIEEGLRGGISMISNRFSKANNPYVPDYDPHQDSSYVTYLDANNLYGWAMSQPLPTGEFDWLNEKEISNLDITQITDDSEEGYILEVDLKYPKELHDLHNDYPLAPEKMKICPEMLSPYVPNLNDKTKYIVHCRNLKLYLGLGMELTVIHRVLAFQQSPWLKATRNKKVLAIDLSACTNADGLLCLTFVLCFCFIFLEIMLFSAFLVLIVLGSVCGDFRVPILTQPLSTFNLPFLQGFMGPNQAYYDRVTTYNVWKTPRAVGADISAFDVIVGSTAQTMVFDADVLLQRGQLSVAILEQSPLYNCPVQCYTVKDADIENATSLTSIILANVATLEIGEIHQFAVTTMEKKFCFNMTVLEQKLNLSSLRVINDEWTLFVPDIVAAAIKFRADMLSVTVDELAELLNINTTTLYGYNLNQIESIFFPAFDDLVVRKNRFETQLFSVVISGQASSQWQSRTMVYYANQISQFSVRHLEILYRWASAQLFAIENIQLSSYFSQCTSLSTTGPAFDLSQEIFGYQTTLPSCNVAFVLSRSLSEDEVQARQGLTNAQIITYSVPQIAYAIRTLNGSGNLNLIMRDNYQQYLSLLLQKYGFSKSTLGALTGRTVAQIDSLTIQEAHNLVFGALYLRYNINEFLSKLTVEGVDNFVAINLPSFEWYRLVRIAIESSFDQLASAFSTNLTAGTGGVSVITLADGTTVSEIYQRTMPTYQTLYQSSAVDLMNRKIVLETENLNALLAQLGITFDSIKNTETVGQTIENRVGLTAEQLRLCQLCSTGPCDANADCTDRVGSYICTCRTGFTGNGVTCTDLDECVLGTHGCSGNGLCTNTIGSYTCRCNTGYTGNGFTCIDIDECGLNIDNCGQNAACTNTQGSFVCTCNPGYTGDGLSCTDIDECTDNTDNCHTNAACTNNIGSFSCACNVGFSGNGVICVDIDECTLGTHDCHANPIEATCTNTIGSFTCACNTGYTGDGKTCTGLYESDCFCVRNIFQIS
ncbi:Gastrula zinc finger, partial [Paramuricea clavata]